MKTIFSRLALFTLLTGLLLPCWTLGQTTIAQQDFDGGTPSWDYSTNVPFFSHRGTNTQDDVYPAGDGWNDDGFYGLLDDTDWDGNISLNAFTDSVLAIHDLDDEGDFGTNKTARVTFEKVSISGYSGVDITFDYELSGLGSSDDIEYEVYEDGTGQGKTSLSGSGSETYNISSGSISHVKLVFYFEQNGEGEYVGIDNIKLKGSAKSQSEPANQPNSFSASALSNGKLKISWTDASAGSQAPDGYLIKAEQSGSISAPSDGTDPSIDKDLSDGSAVVKVGHGTGGSYKFSGLSQNTEYDFQIWSFTNAESNIDFLNSSSGSSGPTTSATTLANENLITESFEATSTNSDYSYPNGNGRNSDEDIFDRVKGSDYINTTDKYIYSDYDQSHYIAVEDFDDPLPNKNKGIVKIGNIDISNHQDLAIKGAFAAGASTGYDGSDQIEVQVSFDGGSWQTIARFTGATSGSNLQEDTNLNGTGNGTVLDGSFEDFRWDLSNTGDQLSVRVTCNLNTGKEEGAFDNIRVTGKPPKKWDGGASDDNWSSADNWDPNGVPEDGDIVVLDDEFVSGDYTVQLDGNVTNTTIDTLKLLPGSSQNITVERENSLSSFSVNDSETGLIIDDGGTFRDKSSDGLPDNFDNGNGEMLIKSGGTYQVLNSSSFSTAKLVGQINSSSSADGEVIIESTGQSLSASGKTYPTALTLKSKSGSISYTTSGSSPLTIQGDFTIGGNVTYDATGRNSGGNLKVKGDFTNNGTLNLNSSTQTLKLTGSSQQTVNGLSSLKQLTVNASNGVKLDKSLTIQSNGSLTLTDGVVSFNNNSDELVFESGASVSGASSSSYVAGSVKKKGSSDFEFPIGKSGQYAPIEITGFSNSSDFTAEYFKSKSGNHTTSPSNFNNISKNEYWTLNRTNNSGSAADPNVTLYWKSGMDHGIDNPSNKDNNGDYTLRVARYDGSNWVDEGSAVDQNSSSTSGNVQSNTITSFSEFTFGSNSSNDNPLPVELLDFEVKKSDQSVILNWATATETNNKHFVIQHRSDGEWETIGQKPGQGTTTEETRYQFKHEQFSSGYQYYRLKQVDFGGTYTYSPVKSVFVGEEATQTAPIQIYKADNGVILDNQKGNSTNLDIAVLSSEGQMVNRFQKQAKPGQQQLSIPGWQGYSAGVYLIRVRQVDKVKHFKILK